MFPPISRLERSRKELLDLGLRNPLINHRARLKQIKVVAERSAEIHRILVKEGKKMRFAPLSAKGQDELIEKENEAGGSSNAVDWEDLLGQPDEELAGEQSEDRHTDNILQTSLVSEKLQPRLLSIHNDARTYIEEQGVNIFFLVCFLFLWDNLDARYCHQDQ